MSAVADAVSCSGYPLQTRVAAIASDVFSSLQTTIFEEWSFLDPDQSRRRAMDVRCEVALTDHKDMRVRPLLELLAECKQSDMPWVFFERAAGGSTRGLPRIAGLPTEEIAVTDDDADVHVLPVLDALGLVAEPFIVSPAPCAGTFSRCRRKKGNKLELSGEEAWSSLTEPLLKAADHLFHVAKPVEAWRHFDARLVVPVAVLDAPLLTATESPAGSELREVPWVRVERHESLTGPEFYRRPRVSCFDVVHVNHLRSYLADVKLFVEAFAEAVLRHQKVLAKGRGHDSDLGRLGFDPSRLRPVSELDWRTRSEVMSGDFGRWMVEQVVPLLVRRKPLVDRWPGRYRGEGGPRD